MIGPGGPLASFLDAVEECPLPVIASIDGWCLGAGCEMSMACDLRVGSERCRMGMPPARLGIVYPPGGLQRFLRAIGPAQTRKVFLTARYFDAGEALSMGMLHYLAPGDGLEDLTMQSGRRGGLEGAPLHGGAQAVPLSPHPPAAPVRRGG